jgi:hypothetical protein
VRQAAQIEALEDHYGFSTGAPTRLPHSVQEPS